MVTKQISTPVCFCATISGSPNKSISTKLFIVEAVLQYPLCL